APTDWLRASRTVVGTRRPPDRPPAEDQVPGSGPLPSRSPVGVEELWEDRCHPILPRNALFAGTGLNIPRSRTRTALAAAVRLSLVLIEGQSSGWEAQRTSQISTDWSGS